MDFRSISPKELTDNVFKLLGDDWALLTVKDGDKINPMTVGWGGFGVMWGKSVVYAVVRPERYTHDLLDRQNGFSLTFFDESYKKQLGLCGRQSGRDTDKVAECNFNVLLEGDVPYFEEARIAIICKKLYASDFKREDFLCDDTMIDKWYGGGFHTLYIAEIEKVLIK